MDNSSQNSTTDPLVTINVAAALKELSRLAGVNSITAANQTAFITSMTDAQVAAFVRRLLITGISITP